MTNASPLDTIVRALHQQGTGRRKRREFFRECWNNRGTEALCILACEAGEWGTEILAYHPLSLRTGVNELGFFGGIALGTLSAWWHNYSHGKEHHSQATKKDAFHFAIATELGCVLGATTVDYLAAKYASIVETVSNNPLDFTNMIIRGIALPLSYLIGLGIMSFVTYKKRERGDQFIAKKDLLPLIQAQLGRHTTLKRHLSYDAPNRTLSLEGIEASISLCEKPRDELTSTYALRSPIFRYRPDIHRATIDVFMECLAKEGESSQIICNPFSHDHDPEHSNTSSEIAAEGA